MQYGERAVNRQRVLPRDGSSFMPVLADSAEVIDREFAEGLAQRMDTSPPKTPTKVVTRGGPYGATEFHLKDNEGNILSSTEGIMQNPKELRGNISTANPTLTYISSETSPNQRRKGHYARLLNTLLQNNINVRSSSRNYASEPFHQKFQRNLAPNIETHTRYNSVGRPEFIYMKDPIKDSKQQAVRNVQGWGDLQPDYNTLPMVDFQDTIKPQLGNLSMQHRGTKQTSLDDFGQ